MNNSPITVDDFLSVDENQTIEFFPQDNDIDDDADTLVIIDVFNSTQNGGFGYLGPNGGVEYYAETYPQAPDFDYLTYIVSDGNGGEAPGIIQIKVVLQNDPPEVYFSDFYVTEDEVLQFYAFVSDEEDGFDLSFDLSGPDAGAFTKPDEFGYFNFKNTLDFENPNDANGDNIYELTASYTDSGGLTATASGTITVFETGDTVSYSDDDDTVVGTNNSDFVFLLGGNDSFKGLDGVDEAFGGEGDDTLKGGAGEDYLHGDNGSDLLKGGLGADNLYGGNGADQIFGGLGVDYIYGDGGADLAFGGLDDDVILGGTGNDNLYGELGADTLYGDSGSDQLRGGVGADVISGDSEDDSLYGGAGADDLGGGSENDLLLGEAGLDTLYGGDGNDVLLGGKGNDEHYGGYGNDIIRGDKGDDILYGDAGNDKLSGGAGSDYLDGGEGDDRIDAGGGFNNIFAGEGNDTIFIGHHDGAYTDIDSFQFFEDVLVIRAFDGNARTEVTSPEDLELLALDGLTVVDNGFDTILNFELDNGTSHTFVLNYISDGELLFL